VHLNENHAALPASKDLLLDESEESEVIVEGTFQELKRQLQLKSLPAGFRLNFPLLKFASSYSTFTLVYLFLV
jgi:hypothetical protein